ncbi:hypothetical protein [Geminocystis sp. NIES-3709]|uniref:hypothetical protein n=1 Tax=Geminocystis sp. NIES-3709 TaxID=1617448 RepID=UPI0005FCC929|nr:hypothetical protein [Geminocystis sp. NIES-3709]BAQ65520.1 hypothetical protein GM3709_2285 [Geminocystis sp. NIES-3709]
MENLGYIEIEQGRLDIRRIATGRDMLKALTAQANGGGFISTLIADVCYLNDAPLTSDTVEEFDAGISLAIQEVIFETKQLTPESVESYPKTYFLGDKIIELTEPRKIKHDNKANRMANGNASAIVFWLISLLVKIDEKVLRYDDLLDLPAGEIQPLMSLVTPKKPQFVRVKT